MSETKMYVVLTTWLGTLARGNLVAEADLPTSAPGLLAAQSIRVATPAELKNGVDRSTLPPLPGEEAAAPTGQGAKTNGTPSPASAPATKEGVTNG